MSAPENFYFDHKIRVAVQCNHVDGEMGYQVSLQEITNGSDQCDGLAKEYII